MMNAKKPIGFYLIGMFLALAIFILEVSGFSLLLPGTFLDNVWIGQAQKYAQLIPYKYPVGVGFMILGVVFTVTVFGWFKCLKWGWWMAIIIFAVNGIGDAVSLINGDLKSGLIGVSIAVGIIFYLARPAVKKLFEKGGRQATAVII
jgi:hypothetical protein